MNYSNKHTLTARILGQTTCNQTRPAQVRLNASITFGNHSQPFSAIMRATRSFGDFHHHVRLQFNKFQTKLNKPHSPMNVCITAANMRNQSNVNHELPIGSIIQTKCVQYPIHIQRHDISKEESSDTCFDFGDLSYNKIMSARRILTHTPKFALSYNVIQTADISLDIRLQFASIDMCYKLPINKVVGQNECVDGHIWNSHNLRMVIQTKRNRSHLRKFGRMHSQPFQR